jgi:hypothetical protein
VFALAAAAQPPKHSNHTAGRINHRSRETNLALTTSAAGHTGATSGDCSSCVQRFHVQSSSDSPAWGTKNWLGASVPRPTVEKATYSLQRHFVLFRFDHRGRGHHVVVATGHARWDRWM